MDYSNQDRLIALKAVTNFGMPVDVFYSEGESFSKGFDGNATQHRESRLNVTLV